MKPKTNRRPKERASDKDTVVAYHEFIQGQIQGELNGVAIGPGYMLSRIALASFIFGLACLLVGILIITIRHRHVYLVSWDAQFLGPFFIIMFLLCSGFATFLLNLAKQRTNQYRKDLAFRPIGDYGVAVVHKSQFSYDDQKKTTLKSGTTPHNVRHPGRPGVNDRGNRGDYSKSSGYDSRGYSDDRNRDPDRRYQDRPRRGLDDVDRPLMREGERREGERSRRPPDDGPRRPRPPPGEGGDRPREGGDRPRRPPDDPNRPRRPPGDPNRPRRPPGDPDRPRRPPGDPNRPRRPMSPEEEERRAEARRRYEEDKRRRLEEDRRRAELKKQAEASQQGGMERGVDVEGGTRTYQIQTTVKLSNQPTDESDL